MGNVGKEACLLHFASHNVIPLLIYNGVDANHKDADGRTPFYTKGGFQDRADDECTCTVTYGHAWAFSSFFARLIGWAENGVCKVCTDSV
jgi:hypothetical protein